MPKFNQRKNMNTKLIYCVRNDLKMGKGKIASQCCHGTFEIYENNIKKKKSNMITLWKSTGQAKIILKINSEKEMYKLKKNAEDLKMCTHIVCDAGHTQVSQGSNTVLIIGPDYESRLNQITGHLKLL